MRSPALLHQPHHTYPRLRITSTCSPIVPPGAVTRSRNRKTIVMISPTGITAPGSLDVPRTGRPYSRTRGLRAGHVWDGVDRRFYRRWRARSHRARPQTGSETTKMSQDNDEACFWAPRPDRPNAFLIWQMRVPPIQLTSAFTHARAVLQGISDDD